ncbi:Fic family protein [Flavobacterium psychrophilum]|uniref:Fido domain-containing protein n=1 Tax=Flavobacterium psychrophilum (strain ATCC 49511 / DSM 21280 / CIP 103535 / JIP02/86) TaxID=402612 RepID=A6H1J6_FLAPJ|nr:Fic family protein [Flavobacterium psychrophilum]AIG30897.1 Fic family protein [Flavobacterium psychrophilum]AIG33169.1 Fic family protein [Flavobacterium psychrophilum]AIG35322.1 Fic family protein [Flavobacterium psychrophilum]AIG37685.1 Fic family protein [Flavobacterium psychrophilum]AIG39956.1 Fic family protein [Flavobacterium psychrophilum]
MLEAKFVNYDLKLIEPSFNSSLTDLIIELDYLRKKPLGGSTHPKVFFQLKHIFHTLESIGSARIEGNNTTIAEYIETKLEDNKNVSSDIKEIQNIEKAMEFVEDNILDYPINKMFLSELHKMIVDGLLPPPNGEGDSTPGLYRGINLKINKSNHLPPDYLVVNDYMIELLDFIERKDSPKYDLLKAAIAHHRFVWIHPFGNGNGRTVRLFTYAMLVKTGFNVNVGRIINPTAVFCSNRNDYYEKLSKADLGTEEGILEWCEYVLLGLKEEIEKIDKLSDYDYLKKEILLPSITHSLERKYITDVESKILKKVIEHQVIQASDLKDIFSGKVSAEISRQIKKLIDKKMLIPEVDGGRKYIIRFDNNFLLRGVIKTLDVKGFLPVRD